MRIDRCFLLAIVVGILGACGPPTVEFRTEYRIEYTGPKDARWTRLNSNLTTDLRWELGEMVTGRLASWLGPIEERRLDLPACTVGTVGADCGYVIDPEFDLSPGHAVTAGGGGLITTGTLTTDGPVSLEAVSVPNGIGGGHFHLRRRK